MIAERVVAGELDTNCWLAGSGGPLVVIDPAGDAGRILGAIAGRDVAAIVLTHGHFDHLGAASEVRDATAAPLLVHSADASFITSALGTGGVLFGFDYATAPADRLLGDGDIVEAGGLELRVLHTPGHTPGGICLLSEAEGHLFAGDTLFAGSVGRTDLPGGDPRAMARSIAARIAPLADEIAVHPGHGPDTTIGRERRVNPFFPRA